MSKQALAVMAIKHAVTAGYTPEQTARLLDKFELLAPDAPIRCERCRDLV